MIYCFVFLFSGAVRHLLSGLYLTRKIMREICTLYNCIQPAFVQLPGGSFGMQKLSLLYTTRCCIIIKFSTAAAYKKNCPIMPER